MNFLFLLQYSFRLLFIFIFEGEKKIPGKKGCFRGGQSHLSCRHSMHLNSSENINWLLNRPWLIHGVQKPNCIMGSGFCTWGQCIRQVPGQLLREAPGLHPLPAPSASWGGVFRALGGSGSLHQRCSSERECE